MRRGCGDGRLPLEPWMRLTAAHAIHAVVMEAEKQNLPPPSLTTHHFKVVHAAQAEGARNL